MRRRIGEERFDRTPLPWLLQEEFDYESPWDTKGSAFLNVIYDVKPTPVGSSQFVKQSWLEGRQYTIHRVHNMNHLCIRILDAEWDPVKRRVTNPLGG